MLFRPHELLLKVAENVDVALQSKKWFASDFTDTFHRFIGLTTFPDGCEKIFILGLHLFQRFSVFVPGLGPSFLVFLDYKTIPRRLFAVFRFTNVGHSHLTTFLMQIQAQPGKKAGEVIFPNQMQ